MKKKYLIIGIIIIVILGGALFIVKTPQPNVPAFLIAIFPNSSIRQAVDSSYFVGASQLYAKEIDLDGSKLYITVENTDNLRSQYSFYTDGISPKLIKEVDSFIPVENSQQAFEDNLLQKDITGDGVPEFIIKIESSGSNVTEHEILRLENDSLINIRLQGTTSNQLEFDDISYKDGYVYTTWHGGYEEGKIQYELKNNFLVEIKSVGFFITPPSYSSEDCEIRVKKNNEAEKVIGVKKCDDIWNNFDLYF